jgi:hypothetical protein
MSGAKSTMAAEADVIVGVPICRSTSFVLDRFLANQHEVQTAYPGCRLVLATDEPDFVAELKEQIRLHSVRGDVIAGQWHVAGKPCANMRYRGEANTSCHWIVTWFMRRLSSSP